MKYIYILASILLIVFSFSCEDYELEKKKLAIIAYYVPQDDTPPEQLPLDKLTHIIYSFTRVIDGEMQFQDAEKSGEILRKLVTQKEKHPNLKVMVACGGWGAGGFSDMASSETSRNKFIKSVVEFVQDYQLDGIDIDWEYPAMGAAGIDYRMEDKQNFTLLMKGLREQLDNLERKQILTFASAGWKLYYENIELLEVMNYADYMNIMTYDQLVSSSPFTGHHTPLGEIELEDMKGTPASEYIRIRKEEMAEDGYTWEWEPRSTEKIVNYCIKLGVKQEQIIVGAAFYGRSWKGVSHEMNGLYQLNSGSDIGWCAYHDIREKYENKNHYHRYWDSIAKAPFLYNQNDSIFFSYDDTASVKLKTEYAIKQNLGGIMFWELSNDTKEDNSLLDAIYETAIF